MLYIYSPGHISDNSLKIKLIVNLFSSAQLGLMPKNTRCDTPSLFIFVVQKYIHPIVFNSTRSQLYLNYFKELEAVLSKALSLTAHAVENGEAQDGLTMYEKPVRLVRENITILLTFLKE